MNQASSALIYLLRRSFVNRVRVQFRRVKTPRYAVAFLVGSWYLWSIFSGAGYSRFRGSSPWSLGEYWPPIFESLLALSAIFTWIFGAAEPAIAFSPADIQMLFPAPVSRRALVRLKLAQVQVAILFTVLLWLVLLQRASQLAAVPRALALWVLFTTLYLHRVGASFAKVSAAQRGLRGFRKHIVPVAIAGAAIVAVAWGLATAWPALSIALTTNQPDRALAALRGSAPLRVVIWPFHALVAPVFAPTLAEWVRAIPWALLLLAICYAWVLRAGVGFEEAAMQRAERLAAQRARQRGQGRMLAPIRAGRPAFTLQLRGHPEGAIIWKNITAFKRQFSARQGVIFALAAVALATLWMRDSSTGVGLIAGIAGGGILWLALFGAIAVRADLQQDMLHLQLLRTYPLRSSAIVSAELRATTYVLCILQGLLLTMALIAILASASTIPEETRDAYVRAWPMALAVLITLPAVTALRVAVANAWAVLFPGWVQLGPTRNAGIETIGANMLTVFGSMLAHLLLLLGPAVAGMATYLFLAEVLHIARHALIAWPFVPAGIAFSATAYGELKLIVRWLGRVLSRTDPSAVDAAIA